VLLGGCCDTGKKPLGNPCLVPDAYGNVVGIAQRWEQPDGSVRCEVSGFCEGEDCGAASVPPPPGTATITGTVAVDGGFAAGRTVSLSGASSGTTRTGGGGAFSFTSVNEGSVTVTLSGLPDEVCEYSVDSGFGTPGFDAPVSVAAGSSHVVRFLVTPAP
jgi:hypothetical protein